MTGLGDTLGPYVLEAQIAAGGMGVVYRARNRVTGQLRAIKVVRPEHAKNIDFVDRFVREATIASQLQHPNLVETFEPGIDGDTIYLPMELLEGETLAARLRRVRCFSAVEAAAILVRIAEAVQLLHDRGVVHRDLKPMNVFLARTDEGETPKVIDFGTARDIEDDEHTRTGMVIGSPFYMAVEQAEGRRDIDARADQYALGVIAYQMLTGARPYESDDSRSALAKLLRGEPYAPPSVVAPDVVSPALERVIARALARDREDRFPSTLEFARAFEVAAHAGPALDRDPPTTVHRTPRSGARSGVDRAAAPGSAPRAPRALVWAAVVAVLIVGAISAVALVGDPAWGAPRPMTVTPLQGGPALLGDPALDDGAAPGSPPIAPRAAAPAPHVDAAAPEARAASDVAPAVPDALTDDGEDDDDAPRRARRRRARRARSEDIACGAATGIPCVE